MTDPLALPPLQAIGGLGGRGGAGRGGARRGAIESTRTQMARQRQSYIRNTIALICTCASASPSPRLRLPDPGRLEPGPNSTPRLPISPHLTLRPLTYLSICSPHATPPHLNLAQTTTPLPSRPRPHILVISPEQKGRRPSIASEIASLDWPPCPSLSATPSPPLP